jgi:hypothetical protein
MFKTVKTSELTGAALDWAVAKCEGIGLGPRGLVVYYCEGEPAMWQPSTDWAQSGPVIEREGISITHQAGQWAAQTDNDLFAYGHPRPLVAAMRCYVAGKLGDSVEVPEELLKD